MRGTAANPHPSIRAQRCFALLGMLILMPLNGYE